MIVKITSEGQVTLPARVLEALGVGPGDRLEITTVGDGFIIRPERPIERPRRIDHSKLGILRDLIPPDTPPFDIREFRDGTYDPALRD